MKPYYELHITFEAPPDFNFEAVGWGFRPWKFSRIDGDANLGAGVKSYLTRQAKSDVPLKVLIAGMNNKAAMLEAIDCTVLRRKVELVVHDTREPVL